MTKPTDAASIFEEAIEFGLPIEVAERLAPRLAVWHNDMRGFRRALIEDDPQLALMLGWVRRN